MEYLSQSSILIPLPFDLLIFSEFSSKTIHRLNFRGFEPIILHILDDKT